MHAPSARLFARRPDRRSAQVSAHTIWKHLINLAAKNQNNSNLPRSLQHNSKIQCADQSHQATSRFRQTTPSPLSSLYEKINKDVFANREWGLTQRSMLVDNNFFVGIRTYLKPALTRSAEALRMLLDNLDTRLHKNRLPDDKY